ncbi:MAG: hypothetical protein NTZ78_10240 [Candidatus Aureabacteria bacterium]|nr:hypothetical protein [Candidatus Auribacterota bacterium]
MTTGVKVPDFTGLQMYLKLGTRLAVNGLQLHSTCLYERTMIAFGPRCPSGDLNKQEEDEEKGTFKPVE